MGAVAVVAILLLLVPDWTLCADDVRRLITDSGDTFNYASLHITRVNRVGDEAF